MLEYSLNQTQHPVAIRVPNVWVSTGVVDTTDYSQLNKFKVESKGTKVAILGLGNFFGLANEVRDELKKRFGFDATIINPRFISGIDKELLQNLKEDHKIIVTLEDGQLNGGFGEKIARFYSDSAVKVLNFGGKKEFTDRIPIEQLYERYHLTKELIVQDISNILEVAYV